MKKYIIALDQGTTSSRCIVFNNKAEIVSVAQKEYRQIYPQPGWVEHNPEDIWSSQRDVMLEAIEKSGIAPEEIAAAGITNQRETTIVWDKATGRPVYNAIVWQCRRTADMIETYKEKYGTAFVREKTGLMPDAYFSASKIRWILDHVDGAQERAEKGELLFGTVDTWLVWKLTGGKVHATDYTNASRTMLFNIHELCWNEELLRSFNIPAAMLPEVRPSGADFGIVSSSVLGGNIPIAGVVGDQQAALFGQCCFESGETKITYGTGCFMLMNTGAKAVASDGGLITTVAASFENNISYALEGSAFVCGALIQWLRDELRLIETAEETEALAEGVDDTAGAYIVPAFTGLGAPYWNSDARGTIVGLTRGCRKEHLVRATLEALALQANDIITLMKNDAGIPIKHFMADGGAARNNLLLQMTADFSGTDIARPALTECTAMGAAFTAGLQTGVWQSREEIKALVRKDAFFAPKMSGEARDKKLREWKRAVRAAVLWAEEK